jgi:hypothetical protein
MAETQGEHTFAEGVLISGDNIDSYTADSALTARTPVAQTGNYAVDEPAADSGNFTGVAGYDVASGQQVPVIKRDCEVRIEVSESVSPGDELVPDGNGGFETVATSGLSDGFLIANESGGSGDLVEAEITAAGGATA